MIIVQSSAQYGNFQLDNGNIRGYYGDISNFEESVILRPPVPGIAKKLYVYLSGTKAAKDTIWVVGDPAEGALPPSLWCNYINAYAAYIIDYKGTPGWHEIDLGGENAITPQNGENGLRVGGLNAVVITHTIKLGGPYFTVDTQNQQAATANSFLNDVYKPNPNFYNIAGTIISLVPGRYMVRLQMDYNYLDKEGKPGVQPTPTLPDVTSQSRLMSASGAAIASELASVADMNNDGLDDLAIRNNFFLNKGDGTFQNISSDINANNSGTIWADIDNDGNIDFYAVRGGSADRIYWGNSDGTFLESTMNNFAIDAPTVSPLFLDYDGDGLLDLFIAYGRKEAGGQEQYFQDKLYKNEGNRTFRDVTVESRIALGEPAPFYDTWGATTCDYNGDGKPDIFVATYRLAPDLLYRNNGDGTFTEVGASTGVRGATTYYENYFGHGMGADWGMLSEGDNNDDLLVGNLSHPDSRALSSNPSLVWLNNQDGTKFSDNTRLSMLGFYEMNAGILMADLNNDSRSDVIHAQYAYYKKNEGRDKFSRIYLNDGGNDLSPVNLRDITWESGARIHGAWSPLRLDYDNDGGIDLLIASSNENAKLFANKLPKGNWITIRLRGDGEKVNRDGFGSSVLLTNKNGKERIARLPGTILNARASQSSNDLHFGLAIEDEIQNIKVVFQDGKIVDAGVLEVNRKYIIEYNGKVTPLSISKPTLQSPPNGSQVSSGWDVELKWLKIGGAVKYRFQLSDNSDFSSLIGNELRDVNMTRINITESVTYYWRVAAIDEFGEQTDWSDVWSLEFGDFSTRLLEPKNNATKVSLNPTFKWTEVLGKLAIRIEIAKDIEFSAKVFLYMHQGLDMLTETMYLNDDLKPSTKYFWRVGVADEIDENGNTDWKWSEVFSFTTDGSTSIEEFSPVEYKFTSVYPNPAKDNVGLEFEIPFFANISIVIFDLAGNKVADICDAYFEPGVHNLNYNASKLPQGTYVIRLTDGVNIRSHNLNILR